MRRRTLLAAVVLVAGACRGPRSNEVLSAEAAVAPGPEAMSLGPNDALEVRVVGEPDLSGAYRVSPEGTIDFPLCGRVQLGGLSAGQATDALTECLKARYMRRPQVVALVRELNSKKVFVFGDVPRPGAFNFEQGMTIVHAISLAGGFNRTAAQNSVNVTRVLQGREMKIPAPVGDIVNGRQRNFPLVPGDIIFVPEGLL